MRRRLAAGFSTRENVKFESLRLLDVFFYPNKKTAFSPAPVTHRKPTTRKYKFELFDIKTACDLLKAHFGRLLLS